MGLTVYGGGGKPEEEKTVTAGTSAIVVLPSSGKTMKKVTVNPTPSQSKTVTPSTSQQTVSPDSGKLLSQVIVKAMEDVTPEVTAQTPIITQIAENLGVTITTPSGTNKQILQGNNANLLNIKDNAKKEGAYVWKRWKIESKQVTLSFYVLNSSSPYQLKVDCDNEMALKIATASSFVGLHGVWNGTGYYEFPDANTLRIYDGSNIYNFTSVYDATTNIFSVTSSTGIGNTSQFADCTHTMQAGTFEGFTVSDQSTAHPDGGTQDGYWYEKVITDGVDLISLFGCTKMAIDKVTFSSKQASGNVFSHSLGEIPKYIFLITNATWEELVEVNTIKESIIMYESDNSYCKAHLTRYRENSNSYRFDAQTASNQIAVTDSTFRIKAETTIGSSSFRFGAGVEYTIITMA